MQLPSVALLPLLVGLAGVAGTSVESLLIPPPQSPRSAVDRWMTRPVRLPDILHRAVTAPQLEALTELLVHPPTLPEEMATFLLLVVLSRTPPCMQDRTMLVEGVAQPLLLLPMALRSHRSLTVLCVATLSPPLPQSQSVMAELSRLLARAVELMFPLLKLLPLTKKLIIVVTMIVIMKVVTTAPPRPGVRLLMLELLLLRLLGTRPLLVVLVVTRVLRWVLLLLVAALVVTRLVDALVIKLTSLLLLLLGFLLCLTTRTLLTLLPLLPPRTRFTLAIFRQEIQLVTEHV